MHVKPQTLAENAPIVSVDKSLGNQYKDVDFDYDAYHRESNRLGMDENAQSSIRIDIAATHPLSGTAGYYVNKFVKVGASKRASKVLSHELQHAADDAEGILNADANSNRYRAGVLAARIAGTPLATASITGTAGMALGNETAEKFMQGPFLMTSLAAGSIALAGYYTNPAERRARKAARETDNNIIKLLEKPKTWYKRVMNRYTAVAAAATLGIAATTRTVMEVRTDAAPVHQSEKNSYNQKEYSPDVIVQNSSSATQEPETSNDSIAHYELQLKDATQKPPPPDWQEGAYYYEDGESISHVDQYGRSIERNVKTP